MITNVNDNHWISKTLSDHMTKFMLVFQKVEGLIVSLFWYKSEKTKNIVL